MKIPTSLSPDLHLAIEAARQAGHTILDAFQTDIVAESKGDAGLVTEFDKRAEQIIAATLRAKSPHSILGEEGGLDGQDSGLVWVVDPIDGTTNFSRKLPLFAVSIALLQGQELILGVILNPTTGDCYFAEQGQGAYQNGQPIQVSANQDPARSIIFLNHGYRADDFKRMTILTRRLGMRYNVRTLGTTALELCLVASGLADAFICSGDSLWDYAAGGILVQEAGGKFTDWRGEPWDAQEAFIFAANDQLYDPLLAEIIDLQPG